LGLGDGDNPLSDLTSLLDFSILPKMSASRQGHRNDEIDRYL
jgi:hypothetical protein